MNEGPYLPVSPLLREMKANVKQLVAVSQPEAARNTSSLGTMY